MEHERPSAPQATESNGGNEVAESTGTIMQREPDPLDAFMSGMEAQLSQDMQKSMKATKYRHMPQKGWSFQQQAGCATTDYCWGYKWMWPLEVSLFLRQERKIEHGTADPETTASDEDEDFDYGAGVVNETVNEVVAVTLPLALAPSLLLQVVPRSAKVLDLGCGNAKLAEESEMYDDGFENITALDISEVAIESMRQRNSEARPRIDWVVGDAFDLQLEDQSFDLVIDKSTTDAVSCDADHIHENMTRMYGEVFRVLKPGGTFLVFSSVVDVPQAALQLPHLSFDVTEKEIYRPFSKLFAFSARKCAEAPRASTEEALQQSRVVDQRMVQERQRLKMARDAQAAADEDAWVAAAQVDPKWKSRGQTALYFAAARQDAIEAEKICRFLMSRMRVPATKRDDWGQSPLFFAARQGHTALCAYFVEKLGMNVHQVDRWGETPMFYAMEAKKTETVIYLLKKGASLGVNNHNFESPESLAPVEVARELQVRMKEWAEPSKAPERSGDTKKRKRPDEEEVEEQGSAAEGPRALQEWAAKPAKLPRNWKTQLAREKLKGEPKVIADTFTHKVTLVTSDALEEVRLLEKTLVADQAVLFKKKLFVRACRAADFCLALGAYEKDGQFFAEYSHIVANRGKVGSLVLAAWLIPNPKPWTVHAPNLEVARDKMTGRIVGFVHAEKGKKELLIGHLKATCFRLWASGPGIRAWGFGFQVSGFGFRIRIMILRRVP
ncbi:EEF1AKNMT [Symbiodinium sp. CCMP2592]|nr:EEF1AKNMT [Symbiodinium sp. CCMP2592]